jgi:hypothetical protein
MGREASRGGREKASPGHDHTAMSFAIPRKRGCKLGALRLCDLVEVVYGASQGHALQPQLELRRPDVYLKMKVLTLVI